jgi:hypothetical protein
MTFHDDDCPQPTTAAAPWERMATPAPTLDPDTLTDRILRVVREEGPIRTPAIAERVGATTGAEMNVVGATLGRLANEGRIDRIGRGLYDVAIGDTPEPPAPLATAPSAPVSVQPRADRGPTRVPRAPQVVAPTPRPAPIDREAAIVRYVTAHPGHCAEEIANALGWGASGTRALLAEAAREGRIQRQTNARGAYVYFVGEATEALTIGERAVRVLRAGPRLAVDLAAHLGVSSHAVNQSIQRRIRSGEIRVETVPGRGHRGRAFRYSLATGDAQSAGTAA